MILFLGIRDQMVGWWGGGDSQVTLLVTTCQNAIMNGMTGSTSYKILKFVKNPENFIHFGQNTLKWNDKLQILTKTIWMCTETNRENIQNSENSWKHV